jgi:hypothetical protein
LAIAAILPCTPGDDEIEAAGDGDILRGYAGRDVLTSAFKATELHGDADDDVLIADVTVSGARRARRRSRFCRTAGPGTIA